MNRIAPWLFAGLLVSLSACSATAPPSAAPNGASGDAGPIGSPFSARAMGLTGGAPLILDRGDLAIGTTVEFSRVPSATEMHDLRLVNSLAHVVLALPAWPGEYAALQGLNQLPQETDVIVLLPGYPPSREAAEAWNLVGARLRLVLLVQTPPPSLAVINDLNTMRALERVIAELDEPSRSGFEHLQRPLSFRKVME